MTRDRRIPTMVPSETADTVPEMRDCCAPGRAAFLTEALPRPMDARIPDADAD
jgi:hypothetical protein